MPFAYFFLESEGFAGSKKVQTMGLYLKMKKKLQTYPTVLNLC